MKRKNFIWKHLVIGFVGMIFLTSCLQSEKKKSNPACSLKNSVTKEEKVAEEKSISITYEKMSVIVYDMEVKEGLAELQRLGLEKLYSKTFKFMHEMAGREETGHEIVFGKGMKYEDGELRAVEKDAVGVVSNRMYVDKYIFVFADKNMRDNILKKAQEAGFKHHVSEYETENDNEKTYIMNVDDVREKTIIVYDKNGLHYMEMYVAVEL
ncbi:MAG: hypothetical protein SOZ80_02780 [Prevotella sp.]|uniref:hypothetical protein n=1 Tax=Prevotella sp. TaxID=59823 RepID=UPI002A3537F7|nr:hypothetical protein [Prevotella sp.]MDD7318306.1 hypothetical protein [Prevotellaceae bacterium]MDY4019690.1 hypothetical protein [Prevotella sp.]